MVRCNLIVNADDFGWSEGVNEAVCSLYDEGIITSTSLMVGGPAARDAVARARSRPGLVVGLHLALVQAPPLLPPKEVPHLVNRHGWLESDCLRAGLRCALLPAYRREMKRELEAQFKAFEGLALGWSHVDSHLHFSLVPPVFAAIRDLARRYRVVGFRVPEDDFGLHRRLEGAGARGHRLHALWFRLNCRRQRRALQSSGWVVPERCYGFFRSGRLDADYLARLVRAMPDGDHELHCHPDLSTESGRAEWGALRSRQFRAALAERGVTLTTYAALAKHRRTS